MPKLKLFKHFVKQSKVVEILSRLSLPLPEETDPLAIQHQKQPFNNFKHRKTHQTSARHVTTVISRTSSTSYYHTKSLNIVDHC